MRVGSQGESLLLQVGIANGSCFIVNHDGRMWAVPTVLLFGNYDDLVSDIGFRAARYVSEEIRRDFTSLNLNTETLVAKVDDLIAAAQNVSEQATEHRAAVDEAIGLIQSLGVDDPRLDEVLTSLNDTATQLDQATTDLAAADDTEGGEPEPEPAPEPEPEPVEPPA